MWKKYKLGNCILIGILMITIKGCNVFEHNTKTLTDGGVVENSDINKADISEKQSYINYLEAKNKGYLEGLNIDTKFNLYKLEAIENISVEEFFKGFKEAYMQLEGNLIKFKHELETNKKYTDAEINKFNQDVLDNLDKTIKEVKHFNEEIRNNTNNNLIDKEKTSFFANLKRLEQNTHITRMELNRLIEQARVILRVT